MAWIFYLYAFLYGTLGIASSTDISRKLPKRQLVVADSSVPAPCTDPDLSPAEYISQDAGGLLLDEIEAIGTPENFPRELVRQITANNIDSFDCSDLNNPDACVAPTGNVGRVCEVIAYEVKVLSTGSDAPVLVIQSYVKMYTFLHNSFQAVQAAHDEIRSSSFLSDMRTDMQPIKDLTNAVVGAVVDIAISFIPIGGAEVAALKSVVKVFQNLTKETVKAVLDVPPNTVPSLDQLQTQLDSLVPAFQQAITDQHQQIFIDSNDDSGRGESNRQFAWLANGVQLGLDIDPDDLKANMVQSMKNYMISSFLGTLSLSVTREDPISANGGIIPVAGCTDGGFSVQLSNFVALYPKLDIFGKVDTSTATTLAHPENLKDGTKFGISLEDILSNAVTCSLGGGDILSIDIDSFLDNPETTIPDCLFGFPVESLNN